MAMPVCFIVKNLCHNVNVYQNINMYLECIYIYIKISRINYVLIKLEKV